MVIEINNELSSSGNFGHQLSPPQWQDLSTTLAKVRPFTMVLEESLIELAHQVRAVLTDSIPGSFVECGVWRGGASFLMAELLRQSGVRDRKVWLFDSFQGLPAPEEIDGPAAQSYAANRELRAYRDNGVVSLEEVQQHARDLQLSSYTEFVNGWFNQTLPANRERIGPIALLRIDCDWHSSVLCCLENLYDQVVEGGLIILDDYYAYDGCAIAVHEFMGKRQLAHRIEPVMEGWRGFQECQSALFTKGVKTWHGRKHDQMFRLISEEVASLIPADDTFILVDQDELRTRIAPERHRVPFLEREGQYWGAPSSDDDAIQELERLRQSGANFIVFAWPAFWWLDYYSGLHDRLRSSYRCLLKNDRVVVFDLRA